MTLKFDLEKVITTEFGIGRDDGNTQNFVAVPADGKVQNALREIVLATWQAMNKEEESPTKYEPSEKHGATEYLYLPLADNLATSLRHLHEANNLLLNSHALADMSDLFCYFTRLTDKTNRRLTALRRATQFKGILKSRGRLVRLVNDSLQVIDDQVFKLDTDFDLLIDSDSVHILRPSGFEFAGKLEEAILEAVSQNITAIQKDLLFVDFTDIQGYASKHPRAARYLASIQGQKETKNIDKSALKNLCKRTGVELTESKGKIIVSPGQELAFLEVLDRRRYEVELVKDKPERFKAGSRQKIN